MRDLVSYFPRAYEDRRVVYTISGAPLDTPVCVRAMAASAPTGARIRGGRDILRLRAVDDGSCLDISYFNQSYLKNALKPGEYYIFYGRVTLVHGRRCMTNPEFESEESAGIVSGRLLPVYRLTAGISRKSLMSIVRNGLELCGGELPNALPEPLRERLQLAQSRFCYRNIHFPEGDGEWFESIDAGDIYGNLSYILGLTTDGEGYMKYAGNELEYTISDLSVRISNNAIASGRSEGYLATATLHLEVPTRFAGRILPPISINLRVEAKYIPKF